MIIVNCKQGSKEWLEARSGAITASMFKDVRKRLTTGKNKGNYPKKADDYAFHLACERLNGSLLEDDQFTTWQMKRGNELEEDARIAHESERGIFVEQCGFVLTEDKKFGCSLDGLIDDDGSSEYKCFTAPSSIKPILLEKDLSEIMDQMQGGMWITNRSYCDFGLYCPQLKNIGHELTLVRVERDEEYIQGLQEDLMTFDKHVEMYVEKLSSKNKSIPVFDSFD